MVLLEYGQKLAISGRSMKPKLDPASQRSQGQLFDDTGPTLVDFIDMKNPLVRLADSMQWELFYVGSAILSRAIHEDRSTLARESGVNLWWPGTESNRPALRCRHGVFTPRDAFEAAFMALDFLPTRVEIKANRQSVPFSGVTVELIF